MTDVFRCHRWWEDRESFAAGSVMDDSLNPPFQNQDLAAMFHHQSNHHREPKDEFPRWANSDGSWNYRDGSPKDWGKTWVDWRMNWVDWRMNWVDWRMNWAGSSKANG
ncbi:hypothetical protein OAF38_00860 [bacterium]|nr:hypothetical protein [bacterium]